jgi:hypothetical protein
MAMESNVYECRICEEEFDSQEELNEHIADEHPTEAAAFREGGRTSEESGRKQPGSESQRQQRKAS